MSAINIPHPFTLNRVPNLPIFHPRQFAWILKRLVDFEKRALGLRGDFFIGGKKRLEEFGDAFFCDENGDLKGQPRGQRRGCHGERITHRFRLVLCSSKMEPIARLYTFIPASCLRLPKETCPRAVLL